MLVSLIITVAIMAVVYFLWQKKSVESLQKTTQKAAEDAGVKVNTQNNTPQGQVDAVRDTVKKIQDKKNSEVMDMDKEL